MIAGISFQIFYEESASWYFSIQQFPIHSLIFGRLLNSSLLLLASPPSFTLSYFFFISGSISCHLPSPPYLYSPRLYETREENNSRHSIVTHFFVTYVIQIWFLLTILSLALSALFSGSPDCIGTLLILPFFEFFWLWFFVWWSPLSNVSPPPDVTFPKHRWLRKTGTNTTRPLLLFFSSASKGNRAETLWPTRPRRK